VTEQLTIDHAIAQRDEGMARAAEHAERVEPGWQEGALEYIRQHALENETLMCEGARLRAEAEGFPLPPHKRAWGAAMMRAAKLGYVAKVGFANVQDPNGHMGAATLWKSLIR
jgi:hypothetical protein